MDDYIIITDSTTDLPHELAQELGIVVVPLTFTIEDKSYPNLLDGSSMAFKDFYSLQRQGKRSSTSQVSAHAFINEFSKHLVKKTDILYLSFSSGLSGTYEQALNASKELLRACPDRRIIVVDTLCASMGEGLLVYLTATQKKAGKTLDEAATYAESMKQSITHIFTVDDLNHLRRGGRLSAASAFLGTMLSIKPILHVDTEGKLVPIAKTRGRKKSLDGLYENMKNLAIDPQNQTVFISHGDCLEDAQYLANLIDKNLHPKKILLNFTGPVVGSHSGAGTVALFFIGSSR